MPALHLLILVISAVLIVIGAFYVCTQTNTDLALKLLFVAIILLSIQNVWIKCYSSDVVEYQVTIYSQ